MKETLMKITATFTFVLSLTAVGFVSASDDMHAMQDHKGMMDMEKKPAKKSSSIFLTILERQPGKRMQ